jgi:hypothetical protein
VVILFRERSFNCSGEWGGEFLSPKILLKIDLKVSKINNFSLQLSMRNFTNFIFFGGGAILYVQQI